MHLSASRRLAELSRAIDATQYHIAETLVEAIEHDAKIFYGHPLNGQCED